MLLFTALCLTLLSVSFAEVPEKCTWRNCYSVDTKPVTFSEATDRCYDMNEGDVADIDSESINNLIKAFLKDSNITTGVWTAIQQSRRSLSWYAAGRSLEEGDFDDFADSSTRTTDIDYPNAVILDPSQDFQWSVARTSETYYTLCSKALDWTG